MTAVCLLWRYLIGSFVVSETKATAITGALESIHVATKKIKKTFERQIKEGNSKASKNAPTRPSFNGQACFDVLMHFEEFLEIKSIQL